jgi:hypothetical protein
MKLVYTYSLFILCCINITQEVVLFSITDISKNRSYLFEEQGLLVTRNILSEVEEGGKKFLGRTFGNKKQTVVKPDTDSEPEHGGIIPYKSWNGQSEDRKPERSVYRIELTHSEANHKPIFRFSYSADDEIYEGQYLLLNIDKWNLMAFVLNVEADREILVNNLDLRVFENLLPYPLADWDQELFRYSLYHNIVMDDTEIKFFIHNYGENTLQYMESIPMLSVLMTRDPNTKKLVNGFYVLKIKYNLLTNITINEHSTFLKKCKEGDYTVTMTFNLAGALYDYKIIKKTLNKSFIQFLRLLKEQLRLGEVVNLLDEKEPFVEVCDTEYKPEGNKTFSGKSRKGENIEMGNIFIKQKINK